MKTAQYDSQGNLSQRKFGIIFAGDNSVLNLQGDKPVTFKLYNPAVTGVIVPLGKVEGRQPGMEG